MTSWLHHLLPSPRLFAPTARPLDGAPQGLAVLTPGPVPSADYYFRSRLERCPGLPALWLDTRAQSPDSLPPGALAGRLAVIVRQAPQPWLRRLEADAPLLAGAALFLDDDLPGAAADPWLPKGYALRTTLRFLRARPALARLCGSVWVATEVLAKRYPEAQAQVLPPLVLPRTGQRPDETAATPLTVFYHGTAAHDREKRWLLEVAAAVQRSRPDTLFELSGGPDVARLYRDIPRVRVTPPLPWPAFLERLGSTPLHIGLAPLLDSPFNCARSHTKFLEISRCGAAGIYARRRPYAEVVQHELTGLLAGDEPDQWVAAVLRLAHDGQLRRSLAVAAWDWCQSQTARWPWERP